MPNLAQALILDISATLLNQTAVKFLIQDTMRILEPSVAGYQLIGETSGTPNVGEAKRSELLQRLFSAVAAASVLEPRQRSSDAPILYFDPIYTLFGPLDERDFVFVLDMTPLTNPDWHNENVSKTYGAAFRKVIQSRCKTIHISRNTMLTMRAVLGSEGHSAAVLHLYLRQLRPGSNAAIPHYFHLGKYLLFVGSLEARKNIAGLICAFDMSRLARQGYKLVIAGGDAHGADRIRALAEATAGVFLLGYVSDPDLNHLYEHATAFVYPSFLEGFGVPLLEAMAYGLPCIASMTGASPEVGGDDVVYVDPYDAPGIGEAMRKIVALSPPERARVSARLQRRANEVFSLENYEKALKQILVSPS